MSEPCSLTIGPLTEEHAFLLSPSTPVNLMGRDLLCKLNATIYCSPEGVFVDIPHNQAPNFLMMLTTDGQGINPDSKLESVELDQVPTSLWASHSNEVGKLLTAEPVRIRYKHGRPYPRVSQYPLSQEAEEGIAPVISSLLEQGVLIRTQSVCNTPILPVKKEGKFDDQGRQIYRFVQDLRAVNQFVIPRFPVVPNPATILSSIPAGAKCFSVIDLCSAFFSIPIDKDSQFLFAFSYKGSS
uniref:Peptidase A2 domain-containing protein n=1 Tax=Pelodiscus sinensis TaxID=13735 RepID=K7FJP6_PELSI